MESKNDFALLSVFLPLAVSTYSFGQVKIRRNMPEGLVFPHIAKLFNAVSAEICLKKPY